MERDVATRIDGMLGGVLASMNGVAHYMNNNLPEEEYKAIIGMVGAVMGEAIEFSSLLHKMFPDIVPKELDPNSGAPSRNGNSGPAP